MSRKTLLFLHRMRYFDNESECKKKVLSFSSPQFRWRERKGEKSKIKDFHHEQIIKQQLKDLPQE
jgi:hypothetical protein